MFYNCSREIEKQTLVQFYNNFFLVENKKKQKNEEDKTRVQHKYKVYNRSPTMNVSFKKREILNPKARSRIRGIP